MGGNQIARHNGTYSRRGAGINQIAGAERDLLRQLRDHLGPAPDHLPDIAALALGAIYRKRDDAALEMPPIPRRRDGAARRGSVEALADFPRQTPIARITLAVAPGQIDADGIAPDMSGRVGNRDVASAAADRDHQLHLELKIGGERWIRHLRAVRHHGVPRFLKEERRIAFVGFLHLEDVVDIVATDAIDPTNGKETATHDRHFGNGD